MNMNVSTKWLLAVAVVCILVATGIAQDTSQTSVTQGQAAQETQVEKGEVVYVSGNNLVVKMDNGEVRHITVPEGATATVDGKQVTIKDVKPGMVLQRTITTTTTPEVVTTVRTIQGKVWHVNPPKTVILTLPDNTNKTYNVPKDQKFMIDGRETTVWDLKKGMNITATVLTEAPQTSVAQQKEVTGQMPTPPQQGPLLVEAAAPEPAPASEPAAPVQTAEAKPAAKLPNTGSELPLLALLGIFSVGTSFGLRFVGRSR